MTSFRTDRGGLIDRSRTLTFRFDGLYYKGHPGDTLASALLANGVTVMGRSFKYHRPRGVWSAWFDDPNAIFNVRLGDNEFPNCPAATTPLVDGMEATAVNAWPNARFDIKGLLDRAHPLLGAGFYYKTFMWPDWHLFEPSIRKMAGLGGLDGREVPDYMADQLHDSCDLLVIGGGVAGLTAARHAAEAGQDVVLIDDHMHLGGSVYQLVEIDGKTPTGWVASMRAAITRAGGRILTRTTASGVYDHQLVALVQDRGFGKAPRLTRMRARRCLLATGALDRPVTFGQNDRPGVMSLNGAAEFLARYGVMVGKRIAVMADHVLARDQLSALSKAGAEIALVKPGTAVPDVIYRRRIRGLRLGNRDLDCDTVLTSAGLMPVVHLWKHAGGKLAWDDAMACFVPSSGPDWMRAIGAANGTFGTDDALAEAQAAATHAPNPTRQFAYSATPRATKLGSKTRQWIDFQHDVTVKDIELAARENYVSVEHLKRYTTLGMAADQGKTSNVAGLSAMAALQGKSIPEVGTTTFRPPFVPVPVEIYRGAHRGQQVSPLKRLPLEATHRALNARLGEYGGWLRPGWYGSGTPERVAQREARMARDAVGVFDASPLGKIEVMGPDAEAFVNFVYYNTMATLKPGHIRYGFMLTEAGIIYDDGVVTRLGPERFLISCSSSHVEGVTNALESWRQDGNDPDRIFVHDTTQNWATVTVTGPKARVCAEALATGVDLSSGALPPMRCVETTLDDHPLRIARVSFTGDASFEVSAPARIAARVWETLLNAAGEQGGGPIGVEALSILRAEKGFIIVGKDTDGETMPHDLGFGVPRARKKTAFVGDRGLHTENANRQDRRRLVGLQSTEVLPVGAHVVVGPAGARMSKGYVSSAYFSPTLDTPIALGMVNADVPLGEEVTLFHLGKTHRATLCDPCFLDPEGERLHAG